MISTTHPGNTFLSLQSRNDLVKQNIRLAYFFAQKYCFKGAAFEDLLSAAFQGLLNAATAYDPARGTFSNVATYFIRSAICNEFRTSRLIYLPHNRGQHSNTVRKCRIQLEQQLKRLPTIEELSNATGLSIDDINVILENESAILSIYQQIDNEPGISLIETLPADPDQEEQELESYELQERIKKLTEKERQIIYSHFWKGKSLVEIGHKLGISAQYTKQLLLKALDKLKKNGVPEEFVWNQE